MSTSTHIEWTDATWNTLSGCTRISEGCLRCYIERTPPFRMNGRKFDAAGIGGKTGIVLHEDRLDLPLHWRNPRRVFVNNLSDLFHDDVPNEHIAAVFAVMSIARQHKFQILTKRPARMRALIGSSAFRLQCEDAQARIMNDEGAGVPNYRLRAWRKQWWSDFAEPLRNVWLGTSVESQKWADIRIPQLLKTRAAVRFLSCEPLLGPITPPTTDGIDWVIVGGESGPGARPMSPDWARGLRDQCTRADVPFFFKQWGEWEPTTWRGIGHGTVKTMSLNGEAARPVVQVGEPLDEWGHRTLMRRIGKKAAGRELDGRTWDQMPATARIEASR